MEQISEQIHQLELALLHTDWVVNPDSIDDLLADDFAEIDVNGHLNARSTVVNWLLQKDRTMRWIFSDFRIQRISNDVVLAVYTARKQDSAAVNRTGSVRSSIWRLQAGSWKMAFHQATRVSEGQ